MAKVLLSLCCLQILILNEFLVFSQNTNEQFEDFWPVLDSLKNEEPDHCSQHKNFFINCTCNALSSDCERIVTAIHFNEEITFYCYIYDKEMGLSKTMKPLKCSLNHNDTLNNILSRFGIEELKTLIFENNGMSIQKDLFNDLKSVTNLILAIRSCRILPSDLFEGLPNVERLEFYTNQEQLPKGLFDPMTSLNRLLVEGKNESIEFTAGMFQYLKNLEYLQISNSKKLILSKDVFDNASSIKELVLDNNNLTSLPSGVFDDLKNLESLIWFQNPFNDLPNDLFRETKTLQSLELIANTGNLRTLPAHFLGNLSALTRVQLSANLEELPQDLFQGSINLKIINLNLNKLRNLSVALFADQKNLEELYLSRNLLTTLPNDIFYNMKNLKKLTLSNNQLTSITDSIFSSLSSLESLNVGNNHLIVIAKDAFCNTEALLHLNLEGNRLDLNSTSNHRNVSPFNNLRKLQELKLSQNSIKRIFSDWRHFNDLLELDLSHNDITEISKEDFEFSALDLHVNLSKNHIETLNFSTHDLIFQNNITIDLTGNPIRCDCSITDFVKYLKNQTNLKIKTEELLCESPTAFRASKLKEIDPCDFRCPRTESDLCPESCRCEYGSCNNVFIINCTNAGLFQLPKLAMLNSIKAEKLLLDLHNNNLRDLPMIGGKNYDKVFSLNLSRNNLESIEAAQLPINLEILDLRRNNLNSLPFHLFEFWSQNYSDVKEIYLSQNPWPCHCDSKDLLEFVQNNHNKVVDRDALQCLDSLNQYQNLMDFNLVQFSQLCPYMNRLTIIVVSAAAFCALMILLLIFYLHRIEVKIWLYSHNMCLWFVSIEVLDKDKKYDGFVSYSHKDKEFVQKKLLPFLEYGPLPFKICDHERDWLVGDTIPQQIIDSVEKSRRTLIILSDNYLDSDWGRMEFQAAHQLSLKERQAKVIIILYGELKNTEKLDAELKAYLKMNTYLEWGNPWFWKKLLYAMPHSKYSKNVREFSSVNED